MSFNVVFISNNKLFPTKFLATSYGICNLVSHILAVAAPLSAEIPDPYPFLVFIGNVVMALSASFYLKEHTNSEQSLGNKP